MPVAGRGYAIRPGFFKPGFLTTYLSPVAAGASQTNWGGSSTYAAGQSFSVATTTRLEGIRIQCGRTVGSTPADNVYVTLHSSAAGMSNNTGVLATSQSVSGASLQTGNHAVLFGGMEYDLQAGTTYYFAIRRSGSPTAQDYTLGVSSVSVYAGGDYYTSGSSGNWSAFNNTDIGFDLLLWRWPIVGSDTTPPTVTFVSQVRTKISRVSPDDATDVVFSVSEDYQAYQVRVVSSTAATVAQGTLLESAARSDFPSTAVLDNFNYTSNPVPTPPWDSHRIDDLTVATQLKATGTALASNTSGAGNGKYGTSFGADQEVYCKLLTTLSTGDYVFLAARISQTPSDTNHWQGYGLIYIAGTGWQLRRYDAGASTVLGTTVTTPALASGDSIGMSVVGSTLTAYRKPAGGSWTALFTRTDTTYSAGGQIGVELGDTTATMRLDDFGGGDVVTKWNAGTNQTITITDAELEAAAGVEGTNLLKIFAQDVAGNWSS